MICRLAAQACKTATLSVPLHQSKTSGHILMMLHNASFVRPPHVHATKHWSAVAVCLVCRQVLSLSCWLMDTLAKKVPDSCSTAQQGHASQTVASPSSITGASAIRLLPPALDFAVAACGARDWFPWVNDTGAAAASARAAFALATAAAAASLAPLRPQDCLAMSLYKACWAGDVTMPSVRCMMDFPVGISVVTMATSEPLKLSFGMTQRLPPFLQQCEIHDACHHQNYCLIMHVSSVELAMHVSSVKFAVHVTAVEAELWQDPRTATIPAAVCSLQCKRGCEQQHVQA